MVQLPEDHMTTSNETPAEVAADGQSRRDFLKKSVMAAGAGLLGGVSMSHSSTAWAAGSDKPEKTEVKIGFIPLTDCAPIVVASVEIRHQDYPQQGSLLGRCARQAAER